MPATTPEALKKNTATSGEEEKKKERKTVSPLRRRVQLRKQLRRVTGHADSEAFFLFR